MKKENLKSEHEIFDGSGTDIENDMPTNEELKSNGKKEDENFFEPNPNKEVELYKEETLPLHTVSIGDIGDLDRAVVVDVELSCDYWKPEGGEVRRVLFDKIDVTQVLSINDPTKIIDLECAFFFVKDGNVAKRICNGSKRLVGALQSANVRHGMALEIVYMGKVKNRNNGFSSDTWSVKPLVIPKK